MRRFKPDDTDQAFKAFLTRYRAHGLLRERASVGLKKWWFGSLVATDLLWVADRAEVPVRARLDVVLECFRLVNGFLPRVEDEPLPHQALAMAWAWCTPEEVTIETMRHMWDLLWTRMHYYTEDPSATWNFWEFSSCPWYRVGWVVLDVISFLTYGFTAPVTTTGFAGMAVGGVVSLIEEDVRLHNITYSLPDVAFCRKHHIESGSQAHHALASIGERAAVNPRFAKPDHWGNPPRMSEEAAAATQSRCADIVRYYIPLELVEEGIRGMMPV